MESQLVHKCLAGPKSAKVQFETLELRLKEFDYQESLHEIYVGMEANVAENLKLFVIPQESRARDETWDHHSDARLAEKHPLPMLCRVS